MSSVSESGSLGTSQLHLTIYFERKVKRMSRLQPTESWTAPSLQPVDFINNCTTYGAFAAPYLRHGAQRVPITDVEAYLIDALRHNDASTILPSRAQLIGWYDNLTANEPDTWALSQMREPPSFLPIWVNRTEMGSFDEECAVELCSNLDFEMDGDIVGIGIMASYYSEGILATIFSFLIILGRLVEHRYASKVSKVPGLTSRFYEAASACTKSLFDAGAVICLATLSGTIIVGAHSDDFEGTIDAWHLGDSLIVNDLEAAQFSAFFSLCPVILIYTFLSETWGGRRLYLGCSVLVVLYAFSLYATFFTYGPRDRHYSNHMVELWETFQMLGCLKGTKETIVRSSRESTYFVLLVLLALIWYLLFLLYRVRRRTLDITGRPSDRQSWSLGQIVALATWIPVVVEFLYMCIFGMKSGLEGRLPAGYEAVAVTTGLDDSAEHVPLRTVGT
ncbi:hypothetical protein BDP55DRAFT_710788 [Colletotrichum godetiae]|uniref:Uncharacterized protein n=1 Tax=Colletotrichum godetiae TaxID=1209918 RepID=A0AAJ0AXK5_9PEZI|nr:uncharacterized protein BDP55DRAFT_710788 [Colletotrichum godetiae]KAK1700165.1 hypothetical protein BDP55DRAFT_710788 [Colletotrichum godetiae]